MTIDQSWVLKLPALFYLFASSSAFSIQMRRQISSNQMANPDVFMDPNFSVGGQANSQTQDQSVMQALSLGLVQSQAQGGATVLRDPPLGSQGREHESTHFQTKDQILQGRPEQSSAAQGLVASQSVGSGNPSSSLTNNLPVGVQTSSLAESSNVQTQGLVAANQQTSGAVGVSMNANNKAVVASSGLQQTVNGNNMFNQGNVNPQLQAPPGTGSAQFNNDANVGNSMLNNFGGNGLSLDPSIFARPQLNPDGSLNGAAGGGNGPPTVGPGYIPNGIVSGSSSNNNNNYNNYNNNNYNINRLSLDPSIFARPQQNPDGSLNGAAGGGNGPPTVGPGYIPNGIVSGSSSNNNNNYNNYNNNNYNSMFGPPSFFMNPSSSFGTNK